MNVISVTSLLPTDDKGQLFYLLLIETLASVHALKLLLASVHSLKFLHVCRSLSLHGMVQTLLPLASKELLSLSCRYHQGIDGLLDLNFIAGLTALTRLELIDFKYLMDLAPLRDIAVKELVILECPRWPAALFVPGALITLQRLHIAHHEEAAVSRAAFMANLRNPASKDHLPAHNLCRLGAIILSLPSLIQLSGKCALFDLGIGEELKGWHRSQYDVLPLSDFDHPSSQYVWNKPAQP